MESKRRHRSSTFVTASLFLVLLFVSQGQAEIERSRRSNQLTHSSMKRTIKSLKHVGSHHTQTLSDECTRHFENWMHNISTTMIPENATLVVDWSELDDLLTAKNCTYEQLWIELWRVNENELPLLESEDKEASKLEFGTPEWFSKYERCDELDETLFSYHSIRAHHRKPNLGIEKKSSKNKNHFNDKADSLKAKQMTQIEPISVGEYGPTYSTKTTFLHVVENSYILRLCPCGKVIRNRRVCDCENTSALCSRVIKIDQPEKAQVFESCRQPEKTKGNTRRDRKPEDANISPPQPKNAITMKSPSTTCTSVLLAGSLTPCTPVQRYDRVKVELHPASVQQMECLWGVDWLRNEEPGSTTIVSVSDLKVADENGTTGDFSVKIENLKENSTFCVVVELVDHPYCDSHLTIGHQLNQPIVCTNHVLQPIILPKCTEEPIIIDNSSSDSRKIIIGTLAGLLGLLAITGFFIFYYRCKSKKRERTERGKLQSPSKPYLNSTPIIKSGALVPNSQATSCTNTLLSKISVTIPDIFLLYFPDTKHFEEINSIFRDWLTSLGNRVFDLSDSKYDEEISKDPESWVMKILMKPNVRILVIDSPVARFSMALASSSTATTSLVSSTASVDSILEHNDDETSNMDETNLKDMEMEDEEEEERIPLSQKQHNSTGNTLQCNASSLGNHPLPECALEDSRYELRVFAMKMIQSRFIGKYKQVIVLRYDNGLPHQNTRLTKPQHLLHHPSSSIYTNKDVSSSTTTTQSSHILDDGGTTQSSMTSFHHHQQEIARKLTPHKQCLVLPQHMPELRSWLRGHGDLYCSERNGNDGLSDFIEMDNALSPSMTEELPSNENPKMNGTNILPHFHRYRLTSTSSSQAYTASTTSHPSSPLLSSALESKLRSSLSTSSSSSTTSSSASNNPNKIYSTRKKSTSSATTTSIV